MSNGNGHRWSKFWWCDWQNDKGLQQCSLAARGLWIELLGLCHASERPGYLLINGEAPSESELADVLGKTNAKEITKLLAELERRRVFSRDESGTLYSRRMVRDVVASEEGREHIAKRWRAGDPNTPPNRGPSRKPNGKANSDPTRDPFTRSLEAEEEAEKEPPVGPHGVGTGTPAEPGTPPARRADGTNPRALGSNPRETGANPRANGSNPRAQSSNPRSKNRFHDKAREMDAQGVTIDGLPQPIVDFYAATGVRPKLIGGASG